MPKVAQATLIYFRLSENWIHTQLENLTDWESIVFTNEMENLDTVDWKPAIFSRTEKLPLFVRIADSLAMWMSGYYPSFYFKAKRENIDLIHAHFGPMGYLCSGLAQHLDIPLVTTFYGYDASMLPKQEPEWKEKYVTLFQRGSRFLVEGPAMKQKLVALGCPEDKITVQYLGIELDKYGARSEYTSQKQINALMVGRFVEKKGFIYGLKAFQKFKEKGGQGTLTIVGDSGDISSFEEVKKELIEFVKKHDLNNSVEFAGIIPLDKLRQKYYNYNVFLAPSVEAENGDNEGGAPVTIIEASATGMPVIGSRHGDIPEVVKDKETGFLADEKDVETLSVHLLKICNNAELREKLGRNGAKHIRENYNAGKQGERLSQIYSDCLK